MYIISGSFTMAIQALIACAAMIPFVVSNVQREDKIVVQSQQDTIQRREVSSFRDPAGQIVIRSGVIFREINPSGRADYNLFITSGLYKALLIRN